ncbi:MAG: hypothetical protein GX444_03160 [Myxococcales bacterium]|nr:hypothetical protein [Myxococcales bacterium]
MKKNGLLIFLFLFLFAAPTYAQTPVDACALLDEPDVWAIMSTSLEMHLRQICGRPMPAVAPSPYWSAEPIAALSGKGDDVLVNDRSGDSVSRSTQSECSITVRSSDGLLLAGWNDSTHYTGAAGSSFAGFGISTDGGAVWTDGGAISGGTVGSPLGDPDVNVGSDGTLWFSCMIGTNVSTGLMATKAPVGGGFGQPIIVHTGPSDDKVLMTIDKTGGAYDGNVYLCAVDFNNFFSFNLFCAASSNGATFGAPVSICPSCAAGSYQAPYPTVGPDGTLYVAWVAFNGSNAQIQIAKSTNGGAGFERLTNPMAAFPPSLETQATNYCGRNALNGNIRYMDFPSLAVAPDGVVHLLFSRHGTGADSADIFYVKSSDDGQTWTTPMRINDDQTANDQFFPTIVANPNGVILAYWYDRRDAPSNINYGVYLSRSLDGGDTWLTNVPVSDVLSPPYSGSDTADCYMGDYNKAVADDENLYVIWSDNRLQIGGHPDPDVYFEAVPVCDNAGFQVALDPPAGTYSTEETPLQVTLQITGDDPACVTEGTLYYTTDGSAPDADSPVYDGPISLTADTLLRVRPLTCCGQIRDEVSAQYVFEAPADDDTVNDDDNDDDNADDDAADDDGGDDDDSGSCGC